MFLNRAAATTQNKIICYNIWKTWRSAALGVSILGEMQSVKVAVTNLIFYTLQSDEHAPHRATGVHMLCLYCTYISKDILYFGGPFQ